MNKSRTQMLLEHLQRWSQPAVSGWSTTFRSTPYISQNLGIRNVPDVVMKLRRKGHIIATARKRVQVGDVAYPDVAVYTYLSNTKKEN